MSDELRVDRDARGVVTVMPADDEANSRSPVKADRKI